MTRGTMRAAHLTLVKLKRKQKEKKGKKRDKNGKKERRGKREGKGTLPYLYDLWRSGSWFLADQELKLEYEVRAKRRYQNLQVSPRFRVGDL